MKRLNNFVKVSKRKVNKRLKKKNKRKIIKKNSFIEQNVYKNFFSLFAKKFWAFIKNNFMNKLMTQNKKKRLIYF